MTEQNRREFLRSVSMAAGSSLLLSYMPWLPALAADRREKISASDRVRLGFVGTGSRGRLLLNHLVLIPQAEIVALCDIYRPQLDLALRITGPGPELFTDYREMLDKCQLDGVLIATPLHQHAHIAIDSLQAGKAVFCEKALARTTADTLAMVMTARKTGKLLLTGHQRMFSPGYIKAFEMIMSGQIGQVTQARAYWHRNHDWRRSVPSPELERQINWRLYDESSCGLMTELFSHQAQVVNHIFGEYPLSVCGSGSINFWKDGREVFDNVNLVFRYPSGNHLLYDSLISNKQYGCEEQILGHLGTMELEAGKFYSETPPIAPGILQLINNIEHTIFDAIPLGGASWVPEQASPYKGTYILDRKPDDDGSRLQMEAFIQAIRSGERYEQLMTEAYYASIWSLLGHEAMITGSIVTLPEELVLPES